MPLLFQTQHARKRREQNFSSGKRQRKRFVTVRPMFLCKENAGKPMLPYSNHNYYDKLKLAGQSRLAQSMLGVAGIQQS